MALRDLQPRLNYGIALLNERRFAETVCLELILSRQIWRQASTRLAALANVDNRSNNGR
ncbi:MAG: hypothetical protein QOH70_656 [Blastocatellia bacterium]|jgi:hypothetical protein|nr:hypothetical protein [Blastocatellia bacterium]